MRRDRLLSFSVALLAGFLGGVLSTKFFSASPVAADTAKSLTAQTFYLVELGHAPGGYNGNWKRRLYYDPL